jgi:hypothetical protein
VFSHQLESPATFLKNARAAAFCLGEPIGTNQPFAVNGTAGVYEVKVIRGHHIISP